MGAKEGGIASLTLEEQEQGGKNVLLILYPSITFSHFLLALFLLSGLISFYPHEFMTCHEI